MSWLPMLSTCRRGPVRQAGLILCGEVMAKPAASEDRRTSRLQLEGYLEEEEDGPNVWVRGEACEARGILIASTTPAFRERCIVNARSTEDSKVQWKFP